MALDTYEKSIGLSFAQSVDGTLAPAVDKRSYCHLNFVYVHVLFSLGAQMSLYT